jgi:hydroxypyruvate reductase
MARIMLHMATHDGPNCMIAGGEPTVRLVPPDQRGKGGRNQQLVLAALAEFCNPQSAIRNPQFALLSAGTDGEDGPTDAAGAMIDGESLARLAAANLDPHDYLRRNDAYTFFEKLGGLIKTGPTHSNVCDVRVVLVEREPQA